MKIVSITNKMNNIVRERGKIGNTAHTVKANTHSFPTVII